MGLGALFRNDNKTIGKTFKKLQDEATLSRQEVRDALSAKEGGIDVQIEAGGEIELTADYLLDAEGAFKLVGNLELDPPEVAEAIGLDEAGVSLDTGREVTTDGDRHAKVRIWVRTTYTAKGDAES